jgi:hypothetical protein
MPSKFPVAATAAPFEEVVAVVGNGIERVLNPVYCVSK